MPSIDVKRNDLHVQIDAPEKRRVQFHVHQATGLETTGSQFKSIVIVENPDNMPCRTDAAKNGEPTVWGENLPLLYLFDNAEVKFVVKKQQPLWKMGVQQSPVAATDSYKIPTLMDLQGSEDRDAFFELDLRSDSRKVGSLRLSIRIFYHENSYQTLTTPHKKALLEQCKTDTLNELAHLEKKMLHLSEILSDSTLAGLVDVTLGVMNAIAKHTDPELSESRTFTNHVSLPLGGINSVFQPFMSTTHRQLSKKNERGIIISFLQDTLVHTVRALQRIEILILTPEGDHLARYQSELRAGNFHNYLQESAKHFLGEKTEKPKAVEPSRRVSAGEKLNTNPDFPRMDAVDMIAPASCTDEREKVSELIWLVSEWAVLSKFKPPAKPFCTTGPSTSKPPSKLFCITVPAGCGKTQLAGSLIEQFNDLRFFGAYYSLDPSRHANGITSSKLLDGLPATIAHQISLIEPDIYAEMKEPMNDSYQFQTLENKFDKLVVGPLRAFQIERLRTGVSANPESLLLIIDDIDECASDERTLESLFRFLTHVASARLPSFLRVLVLGRPLAELKNRLGDVAFVHEVEPYVGYVNLPAARKSPLGLVASLEKSPPPTTVSPLEGEPSNGKGEEKAAIIDSPFETGPLMSAIPVIQVQSADEGGGK